MKVWQWHLIKLNNISALLIRGLYFACNHVLGTLTRQGLALIESLQGKTQSCEKLVLWWMEWPIGLDPGTLYQEEHWRRLCSLELSWRCHLWPWQWMWRPKYLHQPVSHAETLFQLDSVFNSPISLPSSSAHLSCHDACSLYRLGAAGSILCMILLPHPSPFCTVPSVHQVLSTHCLMRVALS